MKSQDKLKLSTLRLVNAAIKNADIEARTGGKGPLADEELLGLMQKMIKQPPSHYLKKMYFDTVTYHLPAARLVVETVGAGHVLYGSDAPPLTSLKPRAIKLVEDLKLPEREREAVFWRNAAGLLKLPVEGAAKAA